MNVEGKKEDSKETKTEKKKSLVHFHLSHCHQGCRGEEEVPSFSALG